MNEGRLTIPKKERKLQYEIRMFQYEFTTYGKLKLHHMSGGSDDFVDSMCFSVYAQTRKKLWFGIR